MQGRAAVRDLRERIPQKGGRVLRRSAQGRAPRRSALGQPQGPGASLRAQPHWRGRTAADARHAAALPTNCEVGIRRRRERV